MALVVVDCAAPAIDLRELERVLPAALWPVRIDVRRERNLAGTADAIALLDACQARLPWTSSCIERGR